MKGVIQNLEEMPADKLGFSILTAAVGVSAPDRDVEALKRTLERAADDARAELSARIRAAVDAARPDGATLATLRERQSVCAEDAAGAADELATAEAAVTTALRNGDDPSGAEAAAEVASKKLKVAKKRAATLAKEVEAEEAKHRSRADAATRAARAGAIDLETAAARQELALLADELGALVVSRLPELFALRARLEQLATGRP